MRRILDEIEGDGDGPLIILVAGLHGNETVGIDAALEVCQKIRDHHIHVRGKLVAVAGNLQAIEKGQRFLDYDLNRAWRPEFMNRVEQNEFKHPEDHELLDLKILFETLFSDTRYSTKLLVDLHATSSENGNFIIIPEAEADNAVIKALHLPVVVDLETFLEGTLLNYYQHLGIVSFAFEGGLIGSKEALELHESGIWEILDTAGMIRHHDHHEVGHYENKLRAISESLPVKVKAFYRHWVEADDDFKMKPGFVNFQHVEKGELLARDKNGPIFAMDDALIFMPLYQDSGNDGFFLVRNIEEPSEVLS